MNIPVTSLPKTSRFNYTIQNATEVSADRYLAELGSKNGFLAVAMSFAMRLSEDKRDEAIKLLVKEYALLSHMGEIRTPLPKWFVEAVEGVR